MLKIFICEDDQKQRENLEQLINNYLFMENLDMALVLSTHDPAEILAYLKANPKTVGLYFLDVDLGHAINGIDLGREIRNMDANGKIVFITARAELMYLTFNYLIEAMDYIVKVDDSDHMKKKIIAALNVAHQRYINESHSQSSPFFEVKIGQQSRFIPIDDIMFFSPSTAHKLMLHQFSSQLEFRGSMKDILDLNGNFLRVHNSYIVNISNIATIDRELREIVMTNGERCLVSIKGLKVLDEALEKMKHTF